MKIRKSIFNKSKIIENSDNLLKTIRHMHDGYPWCQDESCADCPFNLMYYTDNIFRCLGFGEDDLIPDKYYNFDNYNDDEFDRIQKDFLKQMGEYVAQLRDTEEVKL